MFIISNNLNSSKPTMKFGCWKSYRDIMTIHASELFFATIEPSLGTEFITIFTEYFLVIMKNP